MNAWKLNIPALSAAMLMLIVGSGTSNARDICLASEAICDPAVADTIDENDRRAVGLRAVDRSGDDIPTWNGLTGEAAKLGPGYYMPGANF